MEKTKGPGDVGASLPDKEKPCNDLITIITQKSILAPLLSLGTALEHARGNIYDFGMMRCATGTYLNLYFSGDDEIKNPFSTNKNAIPDTVSIPYGVMVDLMRELCVLACSASEDTAIRMLVESGEG